ncbi:MAG: MucR family transcriptional regulator [Pseudomonadota bacterium]
MTSQENTPAKADDDQLIKITADIVSAYLSNNNISAIDVPEFIEKISQTLQQIAGSDEKSTKLIATNQKPAVPIKKSIHKEYLVCLECGLTFKSLKRHLRAYHDLSPEEYRTKWDLPADYPMTASEYSDRRASIAKDTGLGYSRMKK